MNISFFEFLFLLGCLQGLIMACLLWTSRKGTRLSNRLLATLMALMALACLAVGIPVANQWIALLLDLFPLVTVMPFGPIIYFYTRSLLTPGFRLGKQEKLHFLPVVLDWGSKIIGWIYVGGLLLGVFRQEDGPAWGHVMDQYNTYRDIPHWISITVYLWLAHRLLLRHMLPGEAGTEATYRWLATMHRALAGLQVVYLLFLIPYVIPAFHNAVLDFGGYAPIYIPMVVIIYWIGMKGYLHAQRTTEPAAPKAAAPKKTGTAPPAEVASAVMEALRKAMEEDQLYLDPELTVEKVGRHLQKPPKTVSAVLNGHAGKSFNQYVNEYRVEAVKRSMLDPAQPPLTLVGLAFECGFNSQATFQRAFRTATGQSPGEYLASRRESVGT
jgi:AraC-like DNA-binding protein